MTSRIRKLPSEIVDRIAAGEVVERPASIVKELVENSLDAGATRIDVELIDGGCDAIIVTDDGIGMGAEDLALAFVSHATSKLTEVDDLLHIGSYGFRGEALASMGAVADCRILTRERGSEHGHVVESRGGAVTDIEPSAAAEGTRVEVRNLFRYVPARRKFLRAPGTEASHVTAALHRAAIANPEVAFSLTKNGNASFRVSASEDRRARIARFFGRELFEQLLPVSGTAGSVTIEGFIAPPRLARRNSSWQFLFLNGRPIRDRALAHAMHHGFQGLLMRGQHPVVFLFLHMDPALVDVNVHPAKSEVRFQDGEVVHRLVRRAVREALVEGDLTPEFVPDATRTTASHTAGVAAALSEFLEKRAPPERSLFTPGAQGQSSGAPARVAESPTMPVGRFLQVKDAFLVFEVDDGIAIVDQHALHERILLEQITERVESGSLEVQPLLVPAVVELPGADVDALLAEAEALGRLGIGVDRFGESAVAVRSLPALLSRRAPEEVMRGLAERIRAGRGAGSRTALLDDLMHSMACRSAIMAGDPITEDQAAELMRRADLIENPQSCAHGRPTSLRITFRELIRHFKR